jgi:hypothetical protein
MQAASSALIDTIPLQRRVYGVSTTFTHSSCLSRNIL